MEANKIRTQVSTEAWPEGLYALSVRARNEKGQYMTGASVKISPYPVGGLTYEDRAVIPADGVVLDKTISQFNALVPPGRYEVTFSRRGEEVTVEATVKDPISLTQSVEYRDGHQFYFRDHRWDRYILKENSYGIVKVSSDDVVVDVGAHIGVFTRSALATGAKVISYEPDLDNYRLLLRNGQPYSSKFAAQRAAVVADDSEFAANGYAALWIDADGSGDSSRSALHSLYRTRGSRLPVNVPVVVWSQVVLDSNPTILKVDVEGAELTYDWSILSKALRLRVVTLEIENKRNSQEEKKAIIDSLDSLGFDLVKETNGWSTVQTWTR